MVTAQLARATNKKSTQALLLNPPLTSLSRSTGGREALAQKVKARLSRSSSSLRQEQAVLRVTLNSSLHRGGAVLKRKNLKSSNGPSAEKGGERHMQHRVRQQLVARFKQQRPQDTWHLG
jgi:hypothetical protein